TAFRVNVNTQTSQSANNLPEESERVRTLWQQELRSYAPILADVRIEAVIDEATAVTEYVENIEAALDRYGKFVLLGETGAGKTTLLRQLAMVKAARYQQAQEQDYIVPFPVWINLGDSSNPPEAEALIQHSWKDKPKLKQALDADLDDDFLCLLFDGLN